MNKSTRLGIILGLGAVALICICIGCATKNNASYIEETEIPIISTIEPIIEPTAPVTTIPEATVEPITEPIWNTAEYIDANFQDEIIVIAKIIYREARGISSQTEQACVAWTILNRYDTGNWGNSILEVATAPYQFAYIEDSPTVDDYGRDLTELARDVLIRWYDETNFGIDSGRVLPNGYFYFTGDGQHNHFTQMFRSNEYWDYSLPSPYEASK